jgi:hypothetical protein
MGIDPGRDRGLRRIALRLRNNPPGYSACK